MTEPQHKGDANEKSAEAPPSDTETRAAVRFGLGLLTLIALLALSPYALRQLPLTEAQREALDRVTPWSAGDGVPVARLFERQVDRARPVLAGAAAESQASEEQLLAEALGGNAGADRSATSPAPAPGTNGGSDEGARASLPFSLDDVRDVPLEIEDPSGAMAFFYDRLASLPAAPESAPGAEAEKVRLLVYGTSLNGTDRVTHRLRVGLAEIYGDGGKGFVPMARGWQGQAHQGVRWSSERWATNIVNRGRVINGRYGLGGVLSRTAGEGGESHFETARSGTINRSLTRLEVFHLQQPRGGTYEVVIDENEEGMVSVPTRGELADGRRIFELPAGRHRVEVRAGGGGGLRLFGVVMENDQRGTVVDAIPFIGAYSNVFLKFDEEHLASQIRLRQPDLLMFWMGGNDAAGPYAFDSAEFQREYAESIRRVRAGRPEASCLVMSVLDKGEVENGEIRTIPRVLEIVRAQEATARETGCAFWNAFDAFGGEGTARRWRQHRPAFVIHDLGHLTENGAEVVGALLQKTLLRGLARHVGAIE